jgi:hypothetical protein
MFRQIGEKLLSLRKNLAKIKSKYHEKNIKILICFK